MSGIQHDEGKVPLYLLPFDALFAVAKVFDAGVPEYGEHNWEKGLPTHRVFAALTRHVWKWWLGEDIDPTTGHHHMAHATTRALMLLSYALRQTPCDTRKEHNGCSSTGKSSSG